MAYPQSWDITPITITNTEIGYAGVEDLNDTELLVRMVFKRRNAQDQYGNLVEGNGQFYKYGELSLKFGDNFTYDGIEYTVKGVYPARRRNGTILFTKIEF